MLSKPVMTINGESYVLATTLRVAFKVQSMNEHKPYSEVFQEVAEMPVEKQIDVLYAAFSIGNKEKIFEITQQVFRDYCLDNITAKELMDLLQGVIQGIMGIDFDNENSSEQTDGEDAKN